MSQVFYLLLGIGGIQKFIFGSNRLRIALNASQAVSDVFQGLASNHTQKMEIGYEGGGNALLLFEEESEVKEFLKSFSKYVLTGFPGLQLQYAVEKASKNISGEEFQELLFVLNQKQSSQKVFKGITSPLQFGFGMDCYYGGGAATTLSAITRKSGLKPVSEVTSQFLHNEPQQYHCPSGWNLPKDMEDLGQTRHDDNWIAVVHADGNGLGQMISKTQSLQELKELSKKFSSTVVEAYSNMQKRLVDEKSIWSKELDIAENMLPIRHIILGGDDATWVCHGRLGVYSAKVFIEEFSKVSENKLTACAGIAICKSKYPFFRAYELSERLCASAKEKFRSVSDSYGMLDFHIIHGHEDHNLSSLRSNQYKLGKVSLTQRPLSLSDLKQYTKFIEANSNKNSGWWQELRAAAQSTDSDQRRQLLQWKVRGEWPPNESPQLLADLLRGEKTSPFVDICELHEFVIPEMFRREQ